MNTKSSTQLEPLPGGRFGFTPYQMYRDNLDVCDCADPTQDCVRSAVQRCAVDDKSDAAYTLCFIEFDDQGELWDRKQMSAVLEHIDQGPKTDDLLIMVFAHGWKHSAAPGDENIATFRRALAAQSRFESRFAAKTQRKPRKVVGVYLGWRGGSVTLPLLKELTFWDRKNTAHKVGSGDVAEVLGRLAEIRKARNKQAGDLDQSDTRLVVVGHSFGGAVIFSALSTILTDRFVRTKQTEKVVTGFGDLVVLLNPAFEAQQASGLSDLANQSSRYDPSQLPVMAILTSTADIATKCAFPVGRWFSTFWQKTRVIRRPNPVTKKDQLISQKEANRRAVGHFEPYRTHDLKPVGGVESWLFDAADVRQQGKSSKQWEADKPGSVIDLGSTKLTRTEDSAGRNPYLFIRVHKKIIRNHNHIDDPRLIAFVRHLIQLTTQDADMGTRAKVRAQALE